MIRLLNKLAYRLNDLKKKRYLETLQNNGLKLGKNVLIVDTFFFDPSHCYLISIGDNTIICPNVRLIAHDASTKLFLGYTKFGKIDIKQNCFIGDSAIILPNVALGPNTVIGAGSIVTKSIPSDTVATGNPAKPICSLHAYLEKISTLSHNGKNVFGAEYYIEKLTPEKRRELLVAAGESIAFIE